jgi:hypothetical protein
MRRSIEAWQLGISICFSSMKVVHFKTLLSGLSNEPLSSELVISNATTNSRLESLCFESPWRLEQRTQNFQLATKPFHIQEAPKLLKFKCICVFHFTSCNLCSNDFFLLDVFDVCLLRFYIVTMCALCMLWVLVATFIWCKWFRVFFHCDLHRYLDFDASDFGFWAIVASIQICVIGYSSLCHHRALVIIFTKILSRNFGPYQCLN